MMADWRKRILFSFVFIATFYSSNGCWMEGVDNWALPVATKILDVHRGDVFNRATRDIDGITSFSFFDALNGGPYLTVTHSDSSFIIGTNDAFQDYEEYETEEQMSVTVNFRCTGGTTSILVFVIEVEDTNNNPPQFLPSNDLYYTIFTPTPPGMTITGCFDGIVVRDIDLTTQRIDFSIEENPYFEIEYDAVSSTTAKEFIGIIRTTTFIRSLPEPITLTITATDVDLTNDPPLSTSTTITIAADTEFEFPEEPMFTQPFYLANYTDGNQLILSEPIFLQSGFDELVQFSLEGEYFANFALTVNGNEVSITVVTPLPATVLREHQILLVVRAHREYTSGDSATVVIQLPEEVPLEFERAHYEGTIENNFLQVPQLTLVRGYEGETVIVEVFGEYASFFTTSIQGNAIILSMGTLNDDIINENNVISLEIVASTEYSSSKSIVTLEIIKNDNVTPVLNRPLYTGSYDIETGLTLEQIVFDQGYDETVELSLEGDYNNLFTISQDGPEVILTTGGITPEIFSQQRITLTLQATKPRTVGANAAIIIALPAARQLGFEDSTYRGTLQANTLSLEPIVLNAGYDETVVFLISGEYASYFSLTIVQNQVTIYLHTEIPESIIQQNNLIILTVEASGLNALPTTTSVLLDIIKEDITTPVFSRNIYYGTYQPTSGVNIENINLAQGYGNDVTFNLQGDHAEYFQVSNTDNNVVVSMRSSIPEDVIFSEKVFLFNIIADKPLTVGANAAVLIRFPSELTEPVVMRFEQNTYEAAIENDDLSADNIVLSTGYQADTEFLLSGDFATYFSLTNINENVTLSLVNNLQVDEIESSFIVLEVEARREQAISAWTSVVIDIGKQEVQSLAFTRPYYQGIYSEDSDTLNIEVISLALGYDETVEFHLEGDLASLFSLMETSNNEIIVAALAPLPSVVIEQYNHILFSVVATKPNAADARAAISINIDKEITQSRTLGFDQVSYIGTIQYTMITLEPITLAEGYTQDVAFSLHGDLSSYFALSVQGAGVVSLSLPTAIPDEIIPANRIIVLEIRATAAQSVPAYATIVFNVVVQNDQPSASQLVFDATYYTGSYTTAAGLTMNTPIVLTEGYDDSVEFVLEGEHAQWFEVVQTDNSVTLRLSNSIPAAVLANNRQLVFAIAAQRLASDTARATIIITLADEFETDSILGFDQVTYVGTIESAAITLQPITLIEGYTQDVAFSLHGDLSSYFALSVQGAGVVSLSLPTAIPDEIIPANRIIVLEIRATAAQSVPAYATIVFNVVVQNDQPSAPQLVFDATYYTGSYTTAAGLTMNTPIVLTEGYDDSVEFVLEGEHAQWFEMVQTDNSVTLRLSNSIPAAVLANNRQLVFAIAAQRLASDTARATIIITLADEFETDSILGFDQVTYVGTIESAAITLQPITLIEGYTQDVAFSLHGDLSSYFALSVQGLGVVSLSLPTAIPDEIIPANRIIVLEIRATAAQSVPAYATIVFNVVVQNDQPSAPQLVFDATYYTGSYTTAAGLTMNTPIVLTEGYDDSVEFVLEGEHAQWFEVVQTDNSVTLRLSNSIPAAVLANNRQLVFAIAAQRLASDTARATIVITLADEFETDSILGFDQVTYVGTIESAAITLQPITLIEGYTQDVAFSLHGDLSSYFALSVQGAGVVSLSLPTAIPNEIIPANRIIVLEIRATAAQSVPAYATIVFNVVVQNDQPSAPQLVFDATYYTGSYTTAAGLTMNTPIVLTEGYDDSVEFVLEGEHAQWFEVVQTDNSVTLRLSNSIPAAVLANNRQLVFAIAAQRLASDTVRATIIITLADEFETDSILGFDQVTYVGTIESAAITLQPITLIEGYTQDVAFSLHGDLSSYFALSVQGAGVVSLSLPTAIPDEIIPANRIIVLEIRATAAQSVPAYATIVFNVVVQNDQPSAPQLVFDATYYTGSYTTAAGLTMNTPIVLTEGYDDSVEFVLEGEHAQWFEVVQTDNSVTLRLSNSIPAAVLANNRQLVFAIAAQRLASDTARATIVITLADEFETDSILGFDQVTYVGTIESAAVTLQPITLIEGYTQDVAFSLHGDLSSYFALSVQGAGVVSLSLPTAIPDEIIPANRIIVLEIRATAAQSVPAYATIVFNVVVQNDQPSAPQLVFDATYYTGSYTTAAGLTMNTPIVLTEGYDDSVEFVLEGEHAQWFEVVQTDNSVTLRLSNSIPAAVLANNRQLVFAIAAQRLASDTARATIVITLADEFETDSILGFDQVTYVGTIESAAITLQPITLIEGYTQDVAFSLHGDLSSYFALSVQGAGVVSLSLPTAIPNEIIPANRIIVLEIRATAAQSVPAYATIVFNVVVQNNQPSAPQLVFDATYYTGSYTTAAGLTMNTPIVLTEGYDDSVEFVLEGEHAQWFEMVQTDNSVTLRLSNSIPAAVLANNRQLVFAIAAQRLASDTVRATIIITLADEFETDSILGFDQVTYVGTIESAAITLQPITLIEGYTQDVAFSLHGDLSSYFALSVQGAGVVSLSLPTAIPNEIIPANRIIVLEIRATAAQSVPAYATIVFNVVVQNDQPSAPQLVFDATYYTGSYTTAAGLTMNTPIVLTEGYDDSVEFVLEGEHAQWFEVVQTDNSVTLRLSNSIPAAVLANNRQLVFAIAAQRLASDTVRATIIITLADEFETDSILGFDQVTYVGTIESAAITLQPITLIEGYTQDVAFSLHGDLSSYFALSVQGAGVVSLSLPTAIPDEIIPANRIIVLEIRATAAQSVPAYATIVFNVVVQNDQPSAPQLVFDATYYTGSYTTAAGLTMNTPIVLTEGYDDSVEFVLEGEHAQWFEVVQTDNSVTLRLSNSIPAAVLANNRQLVFAIAAQRLASDTARATIVITLADEFETDSILGFNQVTYVGTIESAAITLQPITLIEGYTQDVAFSLHGDLSSYFALSVQGAGVVSLSLPTAIPNEIIPANRIIVLEIRATAAQSVPAYATIVFNVVVQNDQPSAPQLVFDATYYTGSYTTAAGLTMNTPIVLTEGYDDSVEFVLEGEHAQWFEVVQTDNSVTLRLSNSIPAAVLANNRQLVFAIAAQRLASDTARATIIITLADEFETDSILGFDQVTYVGTIESAAITLQPITLIEGYTQDVAFSLHGDLSSYFALSVQGAGVVSLSLPTAIPDEIIPANRIIVLEIRATAAQSVPAYATIVFNVVVQNDQPSAPQLVFDATYYTGSYTTAAGLTMNTPIVLTEGYDDSVEFVLEGEHAQWFEVVQTDNSVTLRLSNSIPAAVLANNRQLVFAIAAQRLASDTVRATIIITLADEFETDSILGFDQVTYVGTIESAAITLQPITLIEGYTQDVAFSLHGDLSSYFALSVQGAGVVSLSLPTAIPDEIIPANRIIVLEIRATAAQSVPAYATIVFNVVVQNDQPSAPQLVFDATYYTGSYTTAAGLTMNTPIVLTEGYDDSVEFVLEGEHAQWFEVVQTDNSVTLRLSNSIPAAVLANNRQLVFAIAAQRLASDTARATIVITLADEFETDSILGFDQVTYVGTIESAAITLQPITLIEGYTQDVAFSLHGDLSSYFALSVQGAGVVSLSLPTAIPNEIIPANRIIVLEIRATAAQSVPAYATIVFNVVVQNDQPSAPQLVFDATYYTGSYTTAAGLTMNTPIVLTEGYDDSVEFVLEGEHAQWFEVVQTDNSVTLRLSNSIPAAVLANNRQLVFAIAAQRLASDTARATIIITLADEFETDSILGFDQVTYVGTIESAAITLQPITLIEGYTQDVAFSLHGDLSSYFALSVQGAGVVSLSLPTAIPDEIIPANRIIVLEIRATAAQSVPAYATIVFNVVVQNDQPSAPQLVFDATYYTGSYTTAAGLTMNTPIVLTEGYDDSVEFVLEGEHAQWFEVVQTDNSVTLRLSNSIPAAVLANNRQLVFAIAAQRLASDTARATIVITLADEFETDSILGFDQVTYVGTIESAAITLQPITLIEGYTQDVAFSLHGDLSSYFALSVQGAGVVSLSLPTAIPNEIIPANRIIVLEIRATAAQSVPAYATIVFNVVVQNDQPSAPQLVFDATYYTGSYTTAAGLTMNTPIVLTEGYDDSVEFVLEGEHAQWFEVVQTDNSVTLRLSNSIPAAVLANNRQLVFAIAAQRLASDTARATIIITLADEFETDSILGFDQVTYVGTIESAAITLQPITLIEGYTQDVAFSLHGDLSSYFALSVQGAGVVSLSLPTAIPDEIIPANRIIVLEIRATAAQSVPAYATIVFNVVVQNDQPSAPQLVFDATYYTGSYTTAAGLTMNTPIVLTEGYDDSVEFVLEGEHAQWFEVVQTDNSVTLRLSNSIPAAVLANNRQLVFAIAAQRLASDTVRATIIITLADEFETDSILGFDQVTYVGTIESAAITLQPITLIEGYTQDVAFSLHGDLSSYFALSVQGAGVVSLSLPTAIPDEIIPANRIIVLEIRATAAQSVPAYATIVFNVVVQNDQPSAPQLVFDATYYTGSYTTAAGLTMNTPIVLTEGYDDSVEFVLEGEHAQWFEVVQTDNSVTLRVSNSIPAAVLANNRQLVFTIAAQRLGSNMARAAIFITLSEESQIGDDVSFEKLVYEGIIQLSTVQHESIVISNYNGVDVQLHGVYSSLFESRVANGVVTVQASGSLTLPDDVTQVTLELHAAEARAVLLLTVSQSDVPVLPSVTFSSPSYVLNVNIEQTGYVGRVLATADNGEAVVYSLSLNNAHLQTRLSISYEGELHLSARANSGVYTFQVIATTVITQAEGLATIYLTVEATTICGEDDLVVPPLIILDRDEEESHSNLVVLNTSQFEGCQFSLTNRWPLNQNWLYVDETGLHTRSIDREDHSIAFMALSQVQVELILHCESDDPVRTKRSQRTDWLGPYDYGTSKWILTESIPYNARRSLVNLIINDINDNVPIFIGKELEPIAVGYPIEEIEERILPRSLAELQATDADIGINAALKYWSSEDVLAVAPTTGFVHVKNGAQLQDNQRLIVSATDQNGEGLTGEIQLLVKLLDLRNIAVVTVGNAFLDNEQTVLAQMSDAVGYEIKALRSAVISDGLDEDVVSRKKRETTNTVGASLLLYVYGLVQREPVAVDRLTADINNNATVASVIRTISLEDHLKDVEIIITERDIGLLVATIVLGVLLFIIIVLIAIWFFLRWRKNRNYDAFTDENSLTSRTGSVEQLPKLETPKPRLNIEELKKSERRLHDMLNSPIEKIIVEPISPRKAAPQDVIFDFPSPEPNSTIVIQSIDKLKDSEDTDDEFGEVQEPRRKSVVTFNENVEKIIHVEDDIDTVSSESGYEIYKL